MKLNDHNFVIEIRLASSQRRDVAKLPIRKTTDIYTRNSLTCKKSSRIPRHNIQAVGNTILIVSGDGKARCCTYKIVYYKIQKGNCKIFVYKTLKRIFFLCSLKSKCVDSVQ